MLFLGPRDTVTEVVGWLAAFSPVTVARAGTGSYLGIGATQNLEKGPIIVHE